MVDEPATPFDSLEGALEYVGLLREALLEAQAAIGEDIALARAEDATRRVEALQLVTYNRSLGPSRAAIRVDSIQPRPLPRRRERTSATWLHRKTSWPP